MSAEYITYKVSIHTITSKGKPNIVETFVVNANGDKGSVEKFYQDKYKPLYIIVDTVPVENISFAPVDAVPINRVSSATMYSSDSYNVQLDSLPESVRKDIEAIKVKESETEALVSKVRQFLSGHFNDASFNVSSINKDYINVRGFLKRLKFEEIANE